MITHTNRGRLTVDVGGKWRLYTNTIPTGAKAIGVVSRGELGDTGALALIEATGLYVQVNGGAVRSLDQRKVKAALGITNDPGRPAELTGGKRVNVYLDAASLERASQLGNSNVSEGIRVALQRSTK